MVKSAKVCLAITTFWCWHRPFGAFLSGGTPVIIQVDRILVLNLHQWWRFSDPSIPFNSDGRIRNHHFTLSIFPAFSWVKLPFYTLVIWHSYGKIHHFVEPGKSTISMTIWKIAKRLPEGMGTPRTKWRFETWKNHGKCWVHGEKPWISPSKNGALI